MVTWSGPGLSNDISLEKPGPDQVTIEQKAIGLNYIDTYHRSGLYPLKLPIGLGLEGAGVVTDVGENVKEFKVGDKVSYAGIPLGSYSSHRNYPTKNLAFDLALTVKSSPLVSNIRVLSITWLCLSFPISISPLIT